MKHGLNNIIEIQTYHSDSLPKERTLIHCPDDSEDMLIFKNRHGDITNERPMRSLLENFIGGLSAMASSYASNNDWIEYDGTTTTTSDPAFEHADGGAGNDDSGPIVGTDNGSSLALAIDNYALGSKIIHGTGAGQLEYGATTVNAPVASGTNFYLDIDREFSNNSGGDVTIEELALACYWWYPYEPTYYGILSRDVGVGETITNGNSSTVTMRQITSQTGGLTKNFLKWLAGMYDYNTGLAPMTDTSGATEYLESYPVQGNAGYYTAGAGTSNWGLVIGTGTGAADWDDYALDTQIAHGTSAGQMWHSGSVAYPAVNVGSSSSFYVERWFGNMSGGSITIGEVGLYGYQDNINYIMMFRHPVSPTVAVADGESLTIRVYFQVTV